MTRAAIAESLDPQSGSAPEQLRAFLSDVKGIRVGTDAQTAQLTRFGESIADSISRSIDSSLGFRISETFGRLDTTIAKIGDTMQKSNEKVLQRLLDDFLKALEERTRDSFTAMVDASADYANKLAISGEALNTSLSSAAEATRDIASKGQEGLALLKDATAGLSDLLDRSKFSFVEMTAASEAVTRTQKATSTMLRQLNEAQERANGAVAGLGVTVKALEQAMARSAETSTESNKVFIAKATSTYERYRETFEELNKHVRESLTSMSADVARVTDTLRSVATSTDEARGSALSELQAMTDRFEKRSSELTQPTNGRVTRAENILPTIRGEM